MKTLALSAALFLALPACQTPAKKAAPTNPTASAIVDGMYDDGVISKTQRDGIQEELQGLETWPDVLWRLGELGMTGLALWFGINLHRNRTRRKALGSLPK